MLSTRRSAATARRSLSHCAPTAASSVHDQGRGIPVDLEPRTGLSGVEVVFTKLHAGGKFGAGSYNATGGLHGVGSSVVNALSSRLDVEVDRNSATWAMSFRRGVPGTFDGPGPTAKFTPGGPLRKVGRVAKGATGTRVTYWPDRQIFLHDAQLSLRDLEDRARQTSFLVPGLALHVIDARGEEVIEETYRHNGGISEFCEFLATDQPITDVIRLRGTDRFTETVPMLDDEGHMEPADVERDLDIDVAVRWGDGYDTRTQSFVNIIATPKGGTHIAGFERGLTRAFGDALQNTRLLKNGDEVLKEDVLEGMTAVVTVRLAEPQFEGQTKEVLGTPAVSRLVTKVGGRRTCQISLPPPRQRPGRRLARSWRRLSARPGLGSPPGSIGRRSAVRTRWSHPRCRPSWSTAAAMTSTAPSCSSSRATRHSARPNWPGTPNSRPCCRSAERSSTSRRPRSATC